MVVVSFILVFIVCLDLNVFIYADTKYCGSKWEGNTKCIYKCHCLNDASCNETNGSCGGQTYCSPGWIGPGCQYSNLAYTSGDTYKYRDMVNDGMYNTCATRNKFTIDLQRAYLISSFTVFANEEKSKVVIRALVTNSTGENINIFNTCIENITIFKQEDFICTHTIFGQFLTIDFENNASICEIGIHGGRNIALWQNTSQSGTLKDTIFTSDKAVDGDIGNYDIETNHCSHTAENGYKVKPFWTVALGQTCLIERIAIHFRSLHETIFRFSDFSVTIMNQENVTAIYKNQGIPHPKEEIIFTPAPLGDKLTIKLPIEQSHDSNLDICEVQIFACQLRHKVETCTNACPVNCRVSDNQYRCQDYTCPKNQCIGEWKGKYCNQKECSGSELKYKHLRIAIGQDMKSHYLSGDKLFVECFQGYTMNGTGLIECMGDGKWRFGASCSAKMCIVPNDNTIDISIRGKQVQFSKMVAINCLHGYRPRKGVTRIHCNINGTWDGDRNALIPFCEANKCVLPNDTHTYTNVTTESTVIFGTTVKITCDSGFNFQGSRDIYCQPDGTWDYNNNNLAPTCSEAGYQSPYIGIGVGIGSTAFIVIISIVGIILFMKRRKKDHEEAEKASYFETNEARAGNDYCSIEETEIAAETELTNKDTARESIGYYSFLSKKALSKNAIEVENFINYVEEHKGNNGSIVSQFSNLLTGLQYPTEVACLQQNKPKNKYKNIYAYDATRVILNRSKEKSDYINASYINGYDSVKRYVASQGPLKGTEEDFWEMVYQLRSDKIVMLTNVFEEGKQKCVQYWPDENILKFGTMSVHFKSVDRYADFTIRLLSIKQDGSEWRKIRQFHFTAWPDRGVPKYASSLVHFRHKVLSMPTKGKGPLIVHCSAGIGRTGTFIALDILVAQARSTGQVDVLACVETLRRQRVNMVQTVEQYLFLHHALEEALMCKTTATAASDFPELYVRMQQRLRDERTREIDKEFQTLNETSPVLQEEEFASGKISQNKKKNRYSNILPVESHRIYLCSYVPGISDYINAVLLPSYKESKAFIATQTPLPDTVIDFLCLVYENDVSSIVMLNEMDDKKTIGRYWPENDDELNIGPFTVTKSGEENMDCLIIKELNIQYKSKEPHVVKQFQVKFWPDNDMVPSSVSDILTVMEHVQQWQRKAGGHNPVVIHCLNGCDKTGLYCMVEATIERLKIEQDVGIQQIIKQMRSRRPQIIPCIEQFEFCHEAVLEYMQQNETYSNFK